MAPRVLVPVADGSEDIETVTIVDVLRRAGAEVTLASVDGAWVTCAHGTRLAADCLIAACAGQTWDAIALPGGMPGAEHLRDCAALTELLHAQDAAGRTLAAICASPAVVLQHHGLLGTRRATCYPGFEHGMAGYVNARVCRMAGASRAAGQARHWSLRWQWQARCSARRVRMMSRAQC